MITDNKDSIMTNMKKYIQLLENGGNYSGEDHETMKNNDSHYEIDKSFKVEKEHDNVYHVKGNESNYTYVSFDNKEAADERRKSMDERRKQDMKEHRKSKTKSKTKSKMKEDHMDDGMGDIDSGMDDDYSLDSDLEDEMSMSDEPEMDMDYDRLDTDYDSIEYEDPDMPEMESSEEDDLMYNYTATIQLHGYDYPVILHSDSIDEFKTVMRVFRQSGLHPDGEYKWNSRKFDLDADMDQEEIEPELTEADASKENKSIRDMMNKTKLDRSQKKEKSEGGPIDKELDKDRDVKDPMKKKHSKNYDDMDIGVDGYENGREEDVYDQKRNVPTDKQDRTIQHKDVSKDRKIVDSEKPKEKKDYDSIDGGQDIYDNVDEEDVFDAGNDSIEDHTNFDATDREIQDILKKSGTLKYDKSDQGENL